MGSDEYVRRPIISAFLDLKPTFHLVKLAVLPIEGFARGIYFAYPMFVCEQPKLSFSLWRPFIRVIFQGCSFLFSNFVREVVTKITLSSGEHSNTGSC